MSVAGLPIGMVRACYTLGRCRVNSDRLYGPVHGSMDAHVSICGLKFTNPPWWILTHGFNGTITCKKCLKVLAQDPKL